MLAQYKKCISEHIGLQIHSSHKLTKNYHVFELFLKVQYIYQKRSNITRLNRFDHRINTEQKKDILKLFA